ncbi:MAG: SpoIID/LytB domain-containing protein [Defluviitaleaceae bacterium]|nr:SpoIID/LytB domain-containing protein [Defluviitaleaceae bacterium]
MKKLFIYNIMTTIIFLLISPTNETKAESSFSILPIIDNFENNLNNTNDTIRIGLESQYIDAKIIHMQNKNITIGNYVSNGTFNPIINIFGTNMAVVVDDYFYLQSETIFNNFDTALNFANDINKNTVISLDNLNNNTIFSVLIGPFNNYEQMNSIYQNISGFIKLPQNNRRVTIIEGDARILTSILPIQMMSNDNNFMQLSNREYRGIIEFHRHRGVGITPVNIINLEEYLFSVVPSEMPAYWNMEALKAQAIASRSFTAARRGFLNYRGYELCDTVFSQVYSGVQTEHERSTNAVIDTTGQMIFFDGDIVLAVYFSSSGGSTENSENAWIETVPYLRSVRDTFEEGYMEWERQFTLSQINNLAIRQNINIGNIKSISLINGMNGRVFNFRLNGKTGNHYITGENIRNFFSYYGGNLPSRNFTFADNSHIHNYQNSNFDSYENNNYLYVFDSNNDIVRINLNNIGDIYNKTIIPNEIYSVTTSTDYNIKFVGRGWGHGVGMSQFGANSMANIGFNHIQVLQHYFTGVEIR